MLFFMNPQQRIDLIFPLNCLEKDEAEELCVLIDRNEKEGGLFGKDRNRFDALLHKAGN